MGVNRHALAPKVILAMAAMLAFACSKQTVDPQQSSSSPRNQTYRIEGQVVLSDGRDSSGIQVFIPGSSALAMSDSKGRFRLANLPPGQYAVVAQHAGYLTLELGQVSISSTDNQETYKMLPAQLDPVATPEPPMPEVVFGSIRGFIRLNWVNELPADQDLGGCRILLDGSPMQTFTNTDGSFTFWNLKPGAYALIAQWPDYEEFRTNVVVIGSKDPTFVDVVLNPLLSEQNRRQIFGAIEIFGLADEPIEDFSSFTVNVI